MQVRVLPGSLLQTRPWRVAGLRQAMHACRYADHQEISSATPTPYSLKGTWCSGITSAPHAEGPGLKSQCVQWRVRSAAVAAVGYRERCCIHASCCLTTLNVSAASSGVLSAPPSQDWPGGPSSSRHRRCNSQLGAVYARGSTPQASAVLLTTGLLPHLGSVTHGLYSC